MHEIFINFETEFHDCHTKLNTHINVCTTTAILQCHNTQIALPFTPHSAKQIVLRYNMCRHAKYII